MARKQKQPEDMGFGEMLSLLATGIKNPKPNNYQYKPHSKQVMFHASIKNGRQYIGGNRSGKTTGGINEDIWWMTGRHPFLELPPPPVYGRIVTVDFKNGANQIIVPQLKQWLAPSDLIDGSWERSWNGQKHLLTLANGSEMEIMSHEQELDKFAGVPRHFIHFDEEPPFDIFKECKARLVDYNGRWWMTMTPVEGMTWTFDEIFDNEEGRRLIDIIQVDTHENPHLSKEAIETMLEGYNEDEKKIRGAGTYVAVSGLVFKHFDADVHVIPSGIPPAHWTHYRSLDHGYSNPTAVLWHAVDPVSGDVVTYKEHYKSEMVVEQHADHIKAEDRALAQHQGISIYLGIADPAIKQRSAVTGHSIQIEYAMKGVNWALGGVRDVNAGLDKMNNYQRLRKWYITEDCPSLIREIRRYKRAQYATSKLREKNNKKEEPQKKDDHAIDSVRYFFSFMPDLNPTDPVPSGKVAPNLMGAPTFIDRPFPIDEHFAGSQIQEIAHDEFVGEW